MQFTAETLGSSHDLLFDAILCAAAFLVCTPVALAVQLDVVASTRGCVHARSSAERSWQLIASLFQLTAALCSSDILFAARQDARSLQAVWAAAGAAWLCVFTGLGNWQSNSRGGGWDTLHLIASCLLLASGCVAAVDMALRYGQAVNDLQLAVALGVWGGADFGMLFMAAWLLAADGMAQRERKRKGLARQEMAIEQSISGCPIVIASDGDKDIENERQQLQLQLTQPLLPLPFAEEQSTDGQSALVIVRPHDEDHRTAAFANRFAFSPQVSLSSSGSPVFRFDPLSINQ